MRNKLLIKTLICSCIFFSTTVLCFGAEKIPTKFDGVKFGDKLPSYFVFKEKFMMTKGQKAPEISYTNPKNTNKIFLDIPIKEILYVFCNSKLSSVQVKIDGINIDQIAMRLSKKIGLKPKLFKANPREFRKYNSYLWNDSNISMHLNVNDISGDEVWITIYCLSCEEDC